MVPASARLPARSCLCAGGNREVGLDRVFRRQNTLSPGVRNKVRLPNCPATSQNFRSIECPHFFPRRAASREFPFPCGLDTRDSPLPAGCRDTFLQSNLPWPDFHFFHNPIPREHACAKIPRTLLQVCLPMLPP